jgi:hypothetical protein
MRMKNLKLIKGVETTPLKKLNESKDLKNPDKYVFQGVFTQCSTPEHKVVNRNGRIYMAQEVLRHLGYLREMIKENNGRILGELDHPEGRFDVQMKEASHAITDLWYDEKTNCVMGRLEVLDTPNGKTLKSIIDAGFPLYVSSRAAGDVNERTKEVEIAQIFTYDVVCTPGFKEARLERVDESLNLSDKALKYINESISSSKNAKLKDISVPASAIDESASNFKIKSIKSLCSPLLEADEDKPLNDVKSFYPIMKTSDAQDLKEEDEKEDDFEDKEDSKESTEKEDSKEEKEELSDEEKEENRKLILDVKGFDDEGKELGTEDSDEDDKSEDIVDIKAKGKDEEDDTDTEDDDESEDKEESKDESTDDDEANECDAPNCKKLGKKDKIKKETDADIDELNSILASVEKAEAVKESIIRRYPFAVSLSESNFAKFASLRPKLKKRCADFIEENEVYDIKMINELWTTPLRADKKMQENWLKFASQEDIDLFVTAPVEVQNAIEESAKYWVLDTQEDVDNFWESTGLRQAAYKKAMNEKFIKDYQSVVSESHISDRYKLGYDRRIIDTMDQWYED